VNGNASSYDTPAGAVHTINWRGKYGGMDVSLMARMKELEAENARLRKMYVEEKIKAEIVAEALAKKD
jgi:putative transposase